jgi:hypothetical protein
MQILSSIFFSSVKPIKRERKMSLFSKQKPIAHYLLASVLLLGLVLSSCRHKQIPLTEGSLAKTKRIGILVKTEGDFSVQASRDKMKTHFFEKSRFFRKTWKGPEWLYIENKVRAEIDQRTTDKVKPIADDFDPKAVMEERLNHYIKLANVFTTQDEEGKPLEGRNLDAILEVTLRSWDLRSCTAHNSKGRVQAGLGVAGRMFSLEDRSTVWQFNEFFLDGECYSLEDFLYREGLLKAVFMRTLDNLSAKIVDEICSPVIPCRFDNLPDSLKDRPLRALRPMNFALVVEDQRKPSERRRISDKEATKAIFEAIEKELKDNGHKLVGMKDDPSGILIHIDLRECQANQIGAGNFSELKWEINGDVKVFRNRDRTVLCSKSLGGTVNKPEGITDSNFKEGREWFNLAVSEFVGSFSRDPDLFQAFSLEAKRKALGEREVVGKETREEFEDLIHNGPKLIAVGKYDQVLKLIADLPRETRWNIQIQTLECFANLAGWLSNKSKNYKSRWLTLREKLINSGANEVTPILISLSKDEKPWLRYFAVELLNFIGDKRALDALRELGTKDEWHEVRAYAKKAYKQISGKKL